MCRCHPIRQKRTNWNEEEEKKGKILIFVFASLLFCCSEEIFNKNKIMLFSFAKFSFQNQTNVKTQNDDYAHKNFVANFEFWKRSNQSMRCDMWIWWVTEGTRSLNDGNMFSLQNICARCQSFSLSKFDILSTILRIRSNYAISLFLTKIKITPANSTQRFKQLENLSQMHYQTKIKPTKNSNS